MGHRLRQTAAAISAFCIAAWMGAPASSQTMGHTLDARVEAHEIPVTIDNFNRVATDIEFAKYIAIAGGLNRFYHFREPTPVDNQPTVSMNRDTLYSAAIVDISEGATLTLPEVSDRYMSAMIVNQDHYINEVFHGGGTYTLDMETFDTPYVAVYMRVLVDASDAEDIAAVNALQDQMSIEAASAEPFILANYNHEAYECLVAALIGLAPFIPDSSSVFGPKEEVAPVRHIVGTAVGWGGLPEDEALYLGIEPRLPVGEYRIEVPADVPVGAFWSISVYNAQRFFEPNDLGAYTVNSVMGERNEDDSMTMHFGGCDDGRVNCLPITVGWNYTVRLYQPGPEILDGSWTFPPVQPVN
jgi:hypothetical protein